MSRDPEMHVATTCGTMTVGDLESRCSVVEPGVILVREVPNGTAATLEVMRDRALELASAFERFVLVVDLTEVTTRPAGDYLHRIHRFLQIPLHTALVQPGSGFLRAVLRFVLAAVSDKSSVHGTREEALDMARGALERAQPPSRENR